jgi:hypothetical protein
MAATLIIEMSDEQFQQLERQAREKGTSPEALAAEYLASMLSSSSPDRLLRWIGAFESSVPDAAERHHEYLGLALYEKLKGGQGR